MRTRAVGFGLAVVALLGFFPLALPPLGHAAVGLAGGFVGGFLAGGGPRPGARHGFVVGAVGGLGALAAGAVLLGTVGVFAPVPDVLGPAVPRALGGSALVLLGSLALVTAATVAGTLGGWLRGDREFPDRMEHERAAR